MAPRPLGRVLGEWAGEYCAGLHTKEGVRLRCGITVTGVRQLPDDRVALETSDGGIEEYDLVVLGTGVSPNTAWLAGSGLAINDGVVCDEFLRADTCGVYAVGDVARWPNAFDHGALVRQEQWTNTVQQAQVVAHNIVRPDDLRSYTSSGYFWSDQHGMRVQSVGGCAGGDVDMVWGSREENSFLAWFFRDDRLVGAFAVNQSRLLMKSKSLVEHAFTRESAKAALADWTA
jgi:NADPH-dependent 2,4-dienoyl-CoA reductase/sulfur reductase-like enzyme